MEIKLTVVVAIYKVEEYLEECLESLRNQPLEEMEVLMVDDGSPDGCGAICDRYAQLDGRFRAIHQTNQGVSVARNRGIQEARGEWITFVDGDDYVVDDYTGKLEFHCFQGCDVVFLGCKELLSGAVTCQPLPEGVPLQLEEGVIHTFSMDALNPDEVVYPQYKNCGIEKAAPWGKLYRRAFLERCQLWYTPGVRRGQDSLFNFEVYQKAETGGISAVYGYVYRRNEGSISNRYNPQIGEMYFTLVHALEEKISACGGTEQMRQRFCACAIRYFLYCCKCDFTHTDNPHSYRERKKAFLELRNHPMYHKAFRDANYSELRPEVRLAAMLCKHRWFGIYQLFWNTYLRLKK